MIIRGRSGIAINTDHVTIFDIFRNPSGQFAVRLHVIESDHIILGGYQDSEEEALKILDGILEAMEQGVSVYRI